MFDRTISDFHVFAKLPDKLPNRARRCQPDAGEQSGRRYRGFHPKIEAVMLTGDPD